jgi:dipeptidyl aminopeptidase/acylaminoacyl peptidase
MPFATSKPMRTVSLLCLAGTVLVSACSTPPSSPATSTLAPNSHLSAQGIPPIPMSLVDNVARYTEFRGHGLVDWHPTQREMLLTHRRPGSNTTQLFRQAGPQGQLEQLTDFADPVSSGRYEPTHGRYLVFERSSGGNEAAQLYRLDLDSRAVTLLSDTDQRHNLEAWTHGAPGRVPQLLSTSVPLDRTAQGGSRASINTTLWLTDPLHPEQRRKVAELPGGGWGVGDVSRDDKVVALQRYLSANQSEVWLLDLATGDKRQLLPLAGDSTQATYQPASFQPDGQGLLFITDRFGEFQELCRLDLASLKVRRISSAIPWDVGLGSASEDGTLLAVQSNEDGLRTLHLFDGRTLEPLPAPALPAGAVGSLQFRKGSHELGLVVNSSAGPGQVFSLDTAKGTLAQWTHASAAPGIDPSRFVGQQVVRWKSFDGRMISGLLSQPPTRFSGKRPVLIDIHGGPEGQASVGFLGRYNYLLEELGVAVIRPNVRGSSGFGKTFLALDNGFQREDSVKDIGALLDWIATQPGLDASRVLVSGGSYGGYMSLAVATHYSDRIAGAIDVVGISHFVTFLNNTESYRRDLRRVEYGDERDPAMRAFQERIAPLNNAAKIGKPLFVVQGRNDPRVPWTEAEQMVKQVRDNGTPVWYLLADNEGHGFARKENADFQFYATVLFIQQTLLR